MEEKATPIHLVWAAGLGEVMAGKAFMVMVPVALIAPHPPVRGIE
jgi:hypothetical protein